MPRRGAGSRRPTRERAVRSMLAIAAAGLGAVSVSHSLAYTMRGAAVEPAHSLAPWDGRITALLSAKLSGPEASAVDRSRADSFARQALRQDPTAVVAVATLGIDAQIRGDTASARQIFSYSNMLSRRDLRTRLWAIEDAVERGDISGALRNYDIALRTSRIAPDLLFPVLITAIADDDIRPALVRTLATRPAWGDQFIAYVSGNGPNARATARLFEALQQRRIVQSEGATAALIARLLSEGHVGDAWRYYSSVNPGVDRRLSRDSKFVANRTTPSSFDWNLVGDSGIAATIQRGERGGIFDFSVPPSLGGPVLEQMQWLPAGSYVLEGHSIEINQPDATLPYWVLRCGEGRELGRVVVPASVRDNGRFVGRFRVPADCPVQHLTLIARATEQMTGTTGQIDSVRLRPVDG